MPRFLAGAALTALLTLVLSSVLGAKTYIPVAASSSGLTEAQQVATPTGNVTFVYPLPADRATDGPLSLDLALSVVAGDPYYLQYTTIATFNGAPLTSQLPTVTLVDPRATPCSTTLGCSARLSFGPDANGRRNGVYGVSVYDRATTFVVIASLAYSGRSVSVTRQAAIQ